MTTNWLRIQREFKAAVSASERRLDLTFLPELEVNTPIPGELYLRYYPFMKEWSAANFVRINDDIVTPARIQDDITAAVKTAWRDPKNSAIVKIYTESGVTRTNVTEFYKGDETALILSSNEVKELLLHGVLVDTDDPVGTIIDLYTAE